jgi:hypothetical protein
MNVDGHYYNQTWRAWDDEEKRKRLEVVSEMKNCLFCVHFSFYEGEPGYSPQTPGDDMQMGCKLDYWEFEIGFTTEDRFRTFMKSAETCGDYQPIVGEPEET